ncbi:MAG TPA: fatty acid desaturase [Kofleriaceae bacterium]|nr:fatty acid desaturase [Kofleriaceae bacterium]
MGSIWAVAAGRVPWWALPLMALLIGSVSAFLTFVTHELLHGGVVRDKRLQIALGWIGFAPLVGSPHLWIAWHNRSHHANTSMTDDPDAYATLDRYAARRSTRFSVDTFSLGGGRWRGVLSLLLGFTVQSIDQLVSASRRGMISRRDHVLAYIETGLGVALWTAVALIVGLVPFLFVFVLPLFVTNAWVMAFILTNHSLSPRLPINDPLVNSLSVTTSRIVAWLTLDFGYHVEHHLFPAMSSRHARAVRALVEERWPERYQSMPLWQAIRRLHRTARVYQDPITLFDPRTQRGYPTLQPRAARA